MSKEELLSGIHKELLKFNKNINNSCPQLAKGLNIYFTVGDIWMVNKDMKRCPTSFAFREMSIKTIKIYYYTTT